MTVEAVHGIGILFYSVLGRNILHAFCSFTDSDDCMVNPWVPLHLTPAYALARFLYTISDTEVRLLRAVMDQQLAQPFDKPMSLEARLHRTLINPPKAGRAGPAFDPRTRPLEGDRKYIIEASSQAFESHLQVTITSAFASIRLGTNKPACKLTYKAK